MIRARPVTFAGGLLFSCPKTVRKSKKNAGEQRTAGTTRGTTLDGPKHEREKERGRREEKGGDGAMKKSEAVRGMCLVRRGGF